MPLKRFWALGTTRPLCRHPCASRGAWTCSCLDSGHLRYAHVLAHDDALLSFCPCICFQGPYLFASLSPFLSHALGPCWDLRRYPCVAAKRRSPAGDSNKRDLTGLRWTAELQSGRHERDEQRPLASHRHCEAGRTGVASKLLDQVPLGGACGKSRLRGKSWLDVDMTRVVGDEG